MDLLQKTKAKDVLPSNRPVVKAHFFEDVASLLKKMTDAQILSVPVEDTDPKVGVIGFVDVLDLLYFVLDIVEQTGKDFTQLNIRDLKWEGQCFSRQSVGHLSNISRSDPLHTVRADTSLIEIVKLFAQEIHRVAIIDKETPEHFISNVLSQSDVLNFITTRGTWMGTKLTSTIKDVGLSPLGVCTVLNTMLTTDVLKFMRTYKVSGVGIVDHSGKLVGNFSATDLLGLTEDTFPLLSLPVTEFFLRLHGFAKPPIYCTVNDSVEFLLLKFAVHKVHRIYLVNETMNPVGVLTMTDIMQFLLASQS